jgi:Helix-turn-helix domain
MHLASDETALFVIFLNAFFREHRDAHVPTAMRQLAVKAALDVDGAAAAARSPALLRAIGPQAAGAAKVQAARIAASTDDGTALSRARSELPMPAGCLLPASEAARIAGVSAQAIRAACASTRLAAAKDKITGQWRISRPDLAEWMEGRRAA